MLQAFRDIILSEQKRGTYAAFKYSEDTVNKINEFISINNLPEPTDDIHTTLLYSTVEAPDYIAAGENIDVAPITFKKFNKFGDVLIMELNADLMIQRHKELMNDFEELIYDYDDYIPHITLSYSAADINPEDLDSSFFDGFEFKVINEYSETLDLEWVG